MLDTCTLRLGLTQHTKKKRQADRKKKGRTMVTDQSSFRFDERSVGAVHLVVEAAGVAEIVSSPVPPP